MAKSYFMKASYVKSFSKLFADMSKLGTIIARFGKVIDIYRYSPCLSNTGIPLPGLGTLHCSTLLTFTKLINSISIVLGSFPFVAH